MPGIHVSRVSHRLSVCVSGRASDGRDSCFPSSHAHFLVVSDLTSQAVEKQDNESQESKPADQMR